MADAMTHIIYIKSQSDNCLNYKAHGW